MLTRSKFSLLPQQNTQMHFNQYESQFTSWLWTASISHCQKQSTCPLKFLQMKKKTPVHCQDNSVLLFIDLGLVDIFLSPLSTRWTEWEITLYLELSKASNTFSAQCSQLDQIRGADYSVKEKSTCFYLKTTVYVTLKMPDPSQQDANWGMPSTFKHHLWAFCSG